jgi:sulfate adenylyltransferase
MPRPHGGKLVNRLVPTNKQENLANEVKELPEIQVSHEIRLDLENIAFGLYSPLIGPITQNDYISILEKGRLSSDLPWTIPILIDTKKEMGTKIKEGDLVVLSSKSERFATLNIEEVYSLDKKRHSQKVVKTLHSHHIP